MNSSTPQTATTTNKKPRTRLFFPYGMASNVVLRRSLAVCNRPLLPFQLGTSTSSALPHERLNYNCHNAFDMFSLSYAPIHGHNSMPFDNQLCLRSRWPYVPSHFCRTNDHDHDDTGPDQRSTRAPRMTRQPSRLRIDRTVPTTGLSSVCLPQASSLSRALPS